MADSSVNQFISRMAASFVPEKAAGVDADIQINLSGSHAGQWYMTIKNQTCNLHEGVSPAPKLTVGANSEDLVDIFAGKMDGMTAFMTGKLKIAGDMALAMKLIGMFKMK